MRLTTSARASPTASIAAVLLLGAEPSGQASSTGPRSITTAAERANVLPAEPVTAMIGRLRLGQGRQEADDFLGLAALGKHQHNVVACTRPRSPCTASAGWRKWLRVPVEASVAVIFWPMSPALPMPVTIVLPRQLKRYSTARQNSWSSRRAT